MVRKPGFPSSLLLEASQAVQSGCPSPDGNAGVRVGSAAFAQHTGWRWGTGSSGCIVTWGLVTQLDDLLSQPLPAPLFPGCLSS